MNLDRHPELRAALEEATLVLKNRLEVDDGKHRFHSELGVFKDELRIIKEQRAQSKRRCERLLIHGSKGLMFRNWLLPRSRFRK